MTAKEILALRNRPYQDMTVFQYAVIQVMKGLSANPEFQDTDVHTIAMWSLDQASALMDEMEKETD